MTDRIDHWDIRVHYRDIENTVRISLKTPVPIVAVESNKYVFGAATNLAFNVAQLGCLTEIIGKITMSVMRESEKSLFLENKIIFDPKLESAIAHRITKSRVAVQR
jgi:bifunctional ADP-heptose synthase (sugar kinase/adenylyltransferase)